VDFRQIEVLREDLTIDMQRVARLQRAVVPISAIYRLENTGGELNVPAAFAAAGQSTYVQPQ
jgi:hypothetical protein